MKRSTGIGEIVHSLGISKLAFYNGHAVAASDVAARKGWYDIAAELRATQPVVVGGANGFVIGSPRATGIIGDIPRNSLSGELLDVARPLPSFWARYLATDSESLIAEEVGESLAISVVGLSATSITVQPNKLGIIIAYSEETVRDSDAAPVIQSDITLALQRGLDAAILTRLAPGSAGGIAATSKPTDDLRKLFTSLNVTGVLSPILVAAPDVAVTMACLRDSGGQVFAEIGPAGGHCLSAPLFVNDRVAAASLLGVNPEPLAFRVGQIEVAVSRETSLQLDTAPSQDASSGTGSTMTSMFQAFSIAVRLTVSFSLIALRGEHVSEEITSIGWTN